MALRIPLLFLLATLAAPSQSETTEEERLTAELEAVVETYRAAGLFAGTVHVARNGQVLLSSGWGPADPVEARPNDPATPIPIASITKSLVAVAVLSQVDEGRLDLDECLATYLPEFTPAVAERITLRQILLHRSGLPRTVVNFAGIPIDELELDRAGLLALLNEHFTTLLFEPGTDFAYSNGGYQLLVLTLERVTGKSYAALMDELVFQPAGLEATRVNPTWAGSRDTAYGMRSSALRTAFVRSSPRHMGFARGSGDMVASASDLARFVEALAAGRLLSEGSTRLALEGEPPERNPVFETSTVTFEGEEVLGLSHSGGFTGYSTHLLHLPGPGLSVVVLTNLEGAPATHLANALVAQLDGRETDPPRAFGPEILAALSEDEPDRALAILASLPELTREEGIFFSAPMAAGAPDLPAQNLPGTPPGGSGNPLRFVRCWTPAPEVGLEWLELHYEEPLETTGLSAVGSFLRHLYSIEGSSSLADSGPGSAWFELPTESRTPSYHPSGLSSYAIELTEPTQLARVRLHFNPDQATGSFLVDALALVDSEGEEHWATHARASSAHFSHAIQMADPDLRPDPYLLELAAADLFDAERPQAALSLLRFITTAYPQGARSQEALGLGLLRAGHPDEARPLLETVLTRVPDRPKTTRALETLRESTPD